LQPPLPSNVLVLDASSGIGPWARDALTEVGFSCDVAGAADAAVRSMETRRSALVIVPIAELASWKSVLDRLGGKPDSAPVLGVIDREASIDVTHALRVGVSDLLTYPCDPKDLVERVAATIRSKPLPPAADDIDDIDDDGISPIASLRAVTEAAEQALFRAETAEARVSRPEEREHLRVARESLSHSLQVLLGTMVGTAESGVAGRAGHSRTVAMLVKKMSQALGWAPERVRGMELAGLLHDIGLLSLPTDLLAAPGPLDDAARRLLHTHADASAEILEPLSRVGVPVSAVRAHHERLDGSGYPRGLRGRQIPVGAELLAVADVYAALTAERPHRPAHSQDEALAILDREVAAGRLAPKALSLLHTVLGIPNGTRPPAVTAGNGPTVRTG
jgi:HD-GYP domain-containing protein (c-di-GMP phosphodiesterase class II)